jgi:hypothetical protein
MRDAEPAQFPDPKYRRVRPRAPGTPIWIHQDGRWLTGHLYIWIKVEDQWIALIQHQHPDDWAHPGQGLYVYDPETIRRRTDDTPPPDE